MKTDNQHARFLVTGGAGFIGSNLVEALLKQGHSVVCLDNLSTGNFNNIQEFLHNENFRFFQGDITDFTTCLDATKDIDYVLHQAAWGSVPRSIQMPIFYETVNIAGTLNIFEAAKRNNVKRVVYASSSSVYGDEPNLPKREGREGNLLSPYAITKRTNEEYGMLYTRLYGLETIGLRYFNVFGRRQNPAGAYAAVVPKFIKALMDGTRPIINGDGLQSRDFTYIENVIQANLKACMADSSATGEVYNIAYGGQETLIDVYRIIQELMSSDIEPIYGPDRAGDIKHSNADISKARANLDYQPEWDFKRGLEAAISWYREYFNETN